MKQLDISVESQYEGIPSLQLRPIDGAGLERLWPLPPEVTQFLPPDEIAGLRSPASLLREVNRNRSLVWGIHVVGEKGLELVGVSFLTDVSRHYPEVGNLLLNCEHRGRHIGALARIAIAEYAWSRYGAYGLQAHTLSANVPAQKSLKWSGFTQTQPAGRQRPRASAYGTDSEHFSTWTQWMFFHPAKRRIFVPSQVQVSLVDIQIGQDRFNKHRDLVLINGT